MVNRTVITGLLVLALASPATPLGERYLLPPALDVALVVDADPSAPGTFTLTGKAKALVVDLGGATLSFRLPPTVEAIGEMSSHRGAFAKDKEVTLTAKVRLKADAKSAMVGLGAAWDYPSKFWLGYVKQHEKEYASLALRDLLYREIEAQGGKKAALSQVSTLEKGGR
jgi:hypothetical protein